MGNRGQAAAAAVSWQWEMGNCGQAAAAAVVTHWVRVVHIVFIYI